MEPNADRARFSPTDLAAIATGGVVGAITRWLISRSVQTDGGWFVYAPNTSVTIGTDVTGFEPARSSTVIDSAGGIPVDTLLVNVIGCLILGGLTLLLLRSTMLPRRLLVAAATGFCGSLTTFSTFAVELAAMLRAQPRLAGDLSTNLEFNPAIDSAVLYLVLSLVGGALAFWLGRAGARRLPFAQAAS